MKDHEQLANIPSNYARIIGRELALNIREIPDLIKFTGLTTEQFMQEDRLLSPQQFIMILHNSLQMAKNPNFGLSLGKRLTSTTHGMMGFLINNSPNLLMALKAFQNFLPTRISFARVHLEYSAHSVIASLYFDVKLSAQVHRMLSETCMVILYECAEFMIGRSMKETLAHFSHAKPDYAALYSEYLAGKCRFSSAVMCIEIPLSTCEIPNVSANQHSYLLAMNQCEQLLQELKPSVRNYSYEIQKIMLSHPLSEMSEENIAEMLFISKRTLARRLQKEGMNFRTLSDEIKSKQALNYLCERKLPVETIATLLNYHDSASFRRAFKRWFGVPPQQYRQSVE